VDEAPEAVVVVVAVELDVTEEDTDVVSVVKVEVGVADSALAGQHSATSLYKGQLVANGLTTCG
jgi:hypothetical protein